MTTGAAAGNTPYWNGTSWVVNSSNIFNNGANVGIGSTSPLQLLTLSQPTTTSFRLERSNAAAFDWEVIADNLGFHLNGGADGTAATLTSFFNIDGLGRVGIGTNTPVASALLEMVSTSKGILIPRMTSAQRFAIASPVTGLLVYDLVGQFYYYNGSAWVSISSGTAVTSVTATTPIISSGGTAPIISMASSGVTPGVYGSAAQIPTFTVDVFGRLTTAGTAAITGLLPAGLNGQTLYNNAGVWTASSNLFNNGSSVGIGTTSPGAGLVVSGSSLWQSAIGIENTGGGTEWRIGSDTDGGLKIVKIPGTTITAMSIEPIAGKITLNSLAPGGTVVANASGLLSVVAGSPLTSNGTANYIPKWNAAGTGLTSTSLLVDNGTTIGIGISTPTGPGKLHVYQNTTSAGPLSYFEHQTSTSSAGINASVYAISSASGTANNYGIYTQANASAAGTTVVGVEAIATNTSVSGQARGLEGVANVSGSGLAIGLFGSASGSTGTNWAGLFNNGNVLITNKLKVGGLITAAPNYPIDINATNYGLNQTDGSVVMSTFINAGTSASIGTQSNHPFFIYTNNGGPKLAVTVGGNVGIGGTAPGLAPLYKLHVTEATAGAISSYFENTNVGTVDGVGIVAKSENAPGYGFGGKFFASYVGINSSATPSSYTGDSYGAYITNSGGTAGVHYGVFGQASGAGGTNFGVYGSASGASLNYAIYSNGIQFSTSGTAWTFSDKNLKRDISDLNINAIETVLKIKTHQYYFDTEKYKHINLPIEKQWGFIAQEIEEVIPEMVKDAVLPGEYNSLTKEKLSDDVNIKSIQYDRLFPVLVKAIQEQQAQIEELKKQSEVQEKQIQLLLNQSKSNDQK